MITLYETSTHSAKVAGTPAMPEERKHISNLAMSNRFTFSEEVAIEQAAETDAEIRVVLRKFTKASYIDLASPQTEQLLDVLVSKGLLTVERKSEILNAPIQYDELP